MKRIILFAAALTCVAATKAQTTTDTLKQQQLDEVVVSGVRVQKNAPYAVANIKKDELESFSKSGRELPFLLARTPGVLAWGENGLGTVRQPCASEVPQAAESTSHWTVWHSIRRRTRRCSGPT